MPDIAMWHPQIVHFVIALSVVGVAARVISVFLPRGRASWIGSMATTLLVLAAVASVFAVQSGDQAHGPAERVPGAREAVHEHEEAGEAARNLLLGLAVIELLGLALMKRPRAAVVVRAIAAAAGLWALYSVYEAGEEGGKVVYSYAGGVGTRSGQPADLAHLLTAGLYHNAMQARDDGRKGDAARWIDELVRIRPDDPDARMLAIESLLEDRGDARGAMAALDTLPAEPGNLRAILRGAALRARAFTVVGAPDSGRALLESLRREHADNPRVQASIDRALKQLDGSGR
jgi:uncharacterized membrane protein